jgi:hypothetical protein
MVLICHWGNHLHGKTTLAQDKDWLGYDRLAVLWDILNSIRETDSYMMIKDEEFRKIWVKRKLIQSGWPKSDWE